MVSTIIVPVAEPEPGGTQSRPCFICNEVNQSTDQFHSHPEVEIVNCICNLFDLEPDLYQHTLSEEIICVKCQQVLQSVVTVFEEMERLHSEVEKSRKLLQQWLTASFGDNQRKIRTENRDGESRYCKARVDLQGKMIGKDPKTPMASSNTESTVGEELEYVVYEIEEPSMGLPPLSPTKSPGPEFHSAVSAQVEVEVEEPTQCTTILPAGHSPPVVVSPVRQRRLTSRTRNKSITPTSPTNTPSTNSESPRLSEGKDLVPVDTTARPTQRTRRFRTSRFDSENFNYYDVGKIFADENPGSDSSPSKSISSRLSSKKRVVESTATVESNEVKSTKSRRKSSKTTMKESVQVSGVPSQSPTDSKSQSLNFACRICGKPFKTNEFALRHEQTHNSPSNPFKCLVPDCDFSYSSDRALNRHVLKFHSSSASAEGQHPRSKQKSCGFCGKSFRTPYMLKQHVETHKPHEERRFVCDVCGFGFLERCRMRRHMKRVHDPSYKLARGPLPKKPCPVCGLFVVNLTSHVRVHTSEKSFVCTDCGKSFLAKKTLDVHARIHTDSRPYPCSQCDAKFRTSHGLSRHAFIHSDERLFVCEHCGKAFRFKSSLSEHLHMHLKVKPYRCNVCGRRCTQAHELEEHLVKDHTPEQLKRRRVRVRRQNPDNATTASTQVHQLGQAAPIVQGAGEAATEKYEFVIEDVMPATAPSSVNVGSHSIAAGVGVVQTQVLHTITIPATTLAGFISDGSSLGLIPVSVSDQSGGVRSEGEGTRVLEGRHPVSCQENVRGDSGSSIESKIRCTALAHPEAEGQVLMGYQLQYI